MGEPAQAALRRLQPAAPGWRTRVEMSRPCSSARPQPLGNLAAGGSGTCNAVFLERGAVEALNGAVRARGARKVGGWAGGRAGAGPPCGLLQPGVAQE